MCQPYSRYRSYEPDEAEPGSDGRVLRNKLRVTDPEMMQAIEENALEKAYIQRSGDMEPEASVTCDVIKEWHCLIFGEIYEWAGEYRTAELILPQAELQFCRSKHIAAAMADYEREYLSKFTPLPKNKLDCCSEVLAKLHAEFIIIHPFRDGNGRTGRYMIDSLLVQVGLSSIDWNTVFHKGMADYHKGIQQSVSRDYSLLASLFREFMNS